MTDGSLGQDHASPRATSAAQPSDARFPLRSQIYVALLWFAFSAQWTTLLSVIIPDQVANIVGPESGRKEGLSGSVLAAGAVLALFVAPLAGALSDRARSPNGRRRAYLITGVVGSCIGLMLMTPFSPGSSLLVYTLAFLNLTFWWNWLAGAYAGLIPDVVPQRDQGLASAWINIMTAIGTGLGNFLVAILYAPNHPTAVLAAFAAISLACLVLTLRNVREPPSAGADDKFELMPFLRSFIIDPRAHPNFYWVLVTRLFVNMGVWSISTMLLFYAQDVVGLAQAANVLPALLGIGAFLSIPASLVAVWLSARYGLILIVQITSWVMVTATLCYVLIPFQPHYVLFAATVLLFSLGWGAYQAVDWALALRVLPSAAGAGKDMGIWHIAFVLPLIIGPVVTGWMVSSLRLVVSAGTAYMAAFGIAALWFVLAAVLIVRVRLRRAT
jgi:Na+/melibiose symporter-like transporter